MQIYGPSSSAVRVVLAPGDAGRLEDEAPSILAAGLVAAGLQVVRFAAPEPVDAAFADAIRRAAATCLPHQRLVLAGLSRGARVSVGLVDELGAVCLVAFAYPFHARRDPHPRGRVSELAHLSVPVLLCQGTRDALGNREQVRGYHLPGHVRVHWLEDANHALHPRARSGHTLRGQLTEAAAVVAAFIRAL